MKLVEKIISEISVRLFITQHGERDNQYFVSHGNHRVDYWEVGNEAYVDLTQLDPAAKPSQNR